MHETGCFDIWGLSGSDDPLELEPITHGISLRSSTQRELNVDHIFCAEYERCFMIRCAKLRNMLGEEFKQVDNVRIICTHVENENLYFCTTVLNNDSIFIHKVLLLCEL